MNYLEKSAELESHFKDVALDCVFLAKNTETLKDLIERSILGSLEFQSMPMHRRASVLGVIEGAQRGIARLCGDEVASKFRAPSLRAPAREVDVPRAVKRLQPGAEWHKHPNGGGWVSDSAYVEASCEVGPKAVVYEAARVNERAKIYGAAKVRGNAECYGSCHIHGLAVVEGHAQIFDSARVLGRAVVGGFVKVGGHSLIRGVVELRGEQEVYDDRVVGATSRSDVRELGIVKRGKAV